jgi:tetratricopeptide (TPR) repeat protein
VRFRSSEELDGEAWSLRQLGLFAELRGELDSSDALYGQAAELFRRLGEQRGLNMVGQSQATLALQRGDYARARALLEESLAQRRELGWDADVGGVLVDLGILALHERRFDDSVTLFVQSLEGSHRHGLRANVSLSLRGLAASAAVRGEHEPAARLLGAAETLQEQTDDVMAPFERSVFARAVEPVADRADEPEIAAALAAGRAMSEPDAVAYALATVTDQIPFSLPLH